MSAEKTVIPKSGVQPLSVILIILFLIVVRKSVQILYHLICFVQENEQFGIWHSVDTTTRWCQSKQVLPWPFLVTQTCIYYCKHLCQQMEHAATLISVWDYQVGTYPNKKKKLFVGSDLGLTLAKIWSDSYVSAANTKTAGFSINAFFLSWQHGHIPR